MKTGNDSWIVEHAYNVSITIILQNYTITQGILFGCSIPFSTEDIDMAIPAIDPSDIELPSFLSEHPCAQFLVQKQK